MSPRQGPQRPAPQLPESEDPGGIQCAVSKAFTERLLCAGATPGVPAGCVLTGPPGAHPATHTAMSLWPQAGPPRVRSKVRRAEGAADAPNGAAAGAGDAWPEEVTRQHHSRHGCWDQGRGVNRAGAGGIWRRARPGAARDRVVSKLRPPLPSCGDAAGENQHYPSAMRSSG